MRKLMTIALALLTLGVLTGAASAGSLSIRTIDRITQFRAACDARGGDFGVIGKHAFCEYPNGAVVKLRSRSDDGFDYPGLTDGRGLLPIFGIGKHRCPIAVEGKGALPELNGSGDRCLRQPYPIGGPILVPIGKKPAPVMEKPILHGLYAGY